MDLDALQADFEAMRDDLPVTIVFLGVSATGTRGAIQYEAREIFDGGGSQFPKTQTLFVSQSDLPRQPKSREEITVNGTKERILLVEESQDGISYKITTEKLYK